jgi:AraC-like DNA-binding protein
MPESREEPSIAAPHALQLVEIAARWGVDAEEICEGLGLAPEALADPRRRLPISLVDRLAARAKALTGEPGLGFHLGLAMRASSYGYLGFAAMAAPTLRDALEVAVRFMPTRTDALALRVEERDGEATIFIDELAPLGEARDVLVLALVVGLNRVAEALTGQRIADRADVSFPEPAYAARFDHLVRGRIRFGQPRSALHMDAGVLARPLVLADASALRLAREQCERELGELGEADRVAGRVRALLARPDGGFRSLEEAAALLSMSPRTLKRRLAGEGTEFSALLDEQRKDRAIALLRSPDVALAAVAEALGYSDTANFSRAFRRWTGSTPAAYRRGAAQKQ